MLHFRQFASDDDEHPVIELVGIEFSEAVVTAVDAASVVVIVAVQQRHVNIIATKGNPNSWVTASEGAIRERR